jgi:serine/threonine protein kinase
MELTRLSGWGEICSLSSMATILASTDCDRAQTYVTLKVYTSAVGKPNKDNREIQIYKHLSEVGNRNHPGRRYIRTILDTFEIPAVDRKHQCLVHKPLWISFYELQHRHPDHRLTTDLLRSLLACLLRGLDYLHSVCNVIHTGRQHPTKLKTILFTIHHRYQRR